MATQDRRRSPRDRRRVRLHVPIAPYSEVAASLAAQVDAQLDSAVYISEAGKAPIRRVSSRDALLHGSLVLDGIDHRLFVATLFGLARDVRLNFDESTETQDSGAAAMAGLRAIFDALCRRPPGRPRSRARFADRALGDAARREWLADIGDRHARFAQDAKRLSDTGETTTPRDLWCRWLQADKKSASSVQWNDLELQREAAKLARIGAELIHRHGASRRSLRSGLRVSARARRKQLPKRAKNPTG
jgi:hypothetical protein